MSLKSKTKNLLAEMEKFGFHPTDVRYSDGHFIFEHGKDSVVHFHLKECKGWLFGIWWDMEDKDQFDFFTQYEREIDKFKPSASTFCVTQLNYSKSKIAEELKWWVCPTLKFIRDYPYVAWYYDLNGVISASTYTTPWQARFEFYKYALKYYHYYPWRERRYVKRYKKLLEKACASILEDPVIVDKDKDGWICYPRFEVVCKGLIKEQTGTDNIFHVDFEDAGVDDKLLKGMKKFDKKAEKIKGEVFLSLDRFDDGVWVHVKK